MTTKVSLLCLLFVGCVYCRPAEEFAGEEGCVVQSCHPVDPNKLNVHLIPHSHDDVGWLKTVDQYYYGLRRGIQWAGVQYIIGSVVEALHENPDRRFIQVETAFFWQWWNKQSEATKRLFRSYVTSGQMEMINGAWSMNDEAAAHYQSIIDQFTLGLRTINDTLGTCGRPKIGWQIDPFGHSNEMASIFTQLGFEALFFARLDHRDKNQRIKDKAMELVWQGSDNLGNKSNLFTSIFTDFYNAPLYFCWDVVCSDEPMVDDEDSPEYNIPERVEDFSKYVNEHKDRFRTNNILIPMGGDFTYQAASMYFENIDRLIAGFKRYNPEMNVIYSTPSCYVKAVNDAAKRRRTVFPSKTDDFFPYASDKHSYWTGYYTSRPNSKHLERIGNNVLQAAKQLATFARVKNENYKGSDNILLKEAMGIMQHHDAITGTEKQAVAQDYARIITKALQVAENETLAIMQNLSKKNSYAEDLATPLKLSASSCPLANVSYCPPADENNFVVVVYNPLSRKVDHYVRLPVKWTNFAILDPAGRSVEFDILPTIRNFSYVHNIRPSGYDLVFLAKDVPAMGMQAYNVTRKSGDATVKPGAETSLGNKNVGFTIDKATGLVSAITVRNKTLNLKQTFEYYNGMNGTNKRPDDRASGAYIFRPAANASKPLHEKNVSFKSYRGKLVDEVHQTFNNWVQQIVRVYKTENHVEFDWIVGPINLINNMGVEVISRFASALKSEDTFYTDSNGRGLVKRVRNHRDTYNYTNEEPVSGNYYPVTSRIVLKDQKADLELAVLNDRAQGGSSLKSGEVELMVHRHLLCDDDFGVGEALEEMEFGLNVVARGRHYVTLGTIKDSHGVNSALYQKDIAQRKLLLPYTMVIGGGLKNGDLEERVNFKFIGLAKPLPENVQILTLEHLNEKNKILLRLEHTYEKGEHSALSKNATVDLKGLFETFEIASLKETALGADRWIEEGERTLQWNTTLANEEEEGRDGGEFAADLKVVLFPMQIRTFIATYVKK